MEKNLASYVERLTIAGRFDPPEIRIESSRRRQTARQAIPHAATGVGVGLVANRSTRLACCEG